MATRVYIDENVYNNLKHLYSSKEEAINRAVSGFLLMRKLTLKELKGIFSKEELIGMVASHNGTIISFDLGITPKFMLTAQMEDSISLERNDAMYSYSGNELLNKINNLTELQAMFLLEEIHRFWNESDTHDLERFLDSF